MKLLAKESQANVVKLDSSHRHEAVRGYRSRERALTLTLLSGIGCWRCTGTTPPPPPGAIFHLQRDSVNDAPLGKLREEQNVNAVISPESH